MDGIGVWKKVGKKGFFTAEGVETSIGANRQELFMNVSFKVNSDSVPTSINGKCFATELNPDAFIGPEEVCTTQTGSFKAKGSGVAF